MCYNLYRMDDPRLGDRLSGRTRDFGSRRGGSSPPPPAMGVGSDVGG